MQQRTGNGLSLGAARKRVGRSIVWLLSWSLALAIPGMAWGQSTVKLTATNKTVVSSVPSGGTASATFRLASAGKIRFQTSVGGTYDEQAPLDEWLEPESATEAANYEVRAVQLSDLPTSGVVNQWLSLGGSVPRDWTMTRSVPGTSEAELGISIRRIGTTTTLGFAKVTLRATVANNPPAVSLTSPANNAVFNPGQLITLQATATDTDGTNSKVEFFDGAALIGAGTASGSTYTRSWTTASIGSHTITAKATDNNGAVTTSASRTIRVNGPPSVSLTAPVSGTSVDKSVNTVLSATASDADSVSKVEFFDNGIQVGAADTTAPYSVTWTPTTIGSHSLTARATDSLGAVATSAPSTVKVNAVKLSATNKTVDSTVASGSTASATFRLATGGKIHFQTSAGGTYDEQAPLDEWLDPESTNETGNYEALVTPVSGAVSSGTVNQWSRLSGTTPTDWTLTNAAADTTAQAVFTLQLRRVGTTTVLASTNITLRARVTAPPNNPPTTSLTSPADNAAFVSGQSIPLRATADDTDGTISQVEFFDGTTLIGPGAVSGSTYTLDWATASIGAHSITAHATDNGSAATVSAPVTLNVTPCVLAVSLVSPLDGSVYNSPGPVDLAAGASTCAQSGITRVEFYQGTTLLDSDTVAPFAFPWDAVPAGAYDLTAKAYNTQGDSATSPISHVIVNALPSVAMTAPADGASAVAASNVVLSADASDSDGTISKVEFYQGATLLDTVLAAPYTFTWNAVAQGSYSLSAIAYDDRNAATVSAPVTLNVTSCVLTVALASPLDGSVHNAPGPVEFTAGASTCAQSGITKVEFYQGTTLLDSDTVAPFAFSWDAVPAGAYDLTAKAYNTLGDSATSPVSHILVNALPSVTMTTPIDGDSRQGPTDFVLSADASDSDGTISRVEF